MHRPNIDSDALLFFSAVFRTEVNHARGVRVRHVYRLREPRARETAWRGCGSCCPKPPPALRAVLGFRA